MNGDKDSGAHRNGYCDADAIPQHSKRIDVMGCIYVFVYIYSLEWY